MSLKQKTIIEIDVTKLDKTKFREFTRKDGTKAIIATMEVIEMDTHSVVTKKDGTPVTGNNSVLNKIGFVSEQSPKGEKGKILGDAKRWIDNSTPAQTAQLEDITWGF